MKRCTNVGLDSSGHAVRDVVTSDSRSAASRERNKAPPVGALYLCVWWFSGASIPGPHAFQACALPTELLNHVHWKLAVPTGLEPAASGLTGRRALQLHHGTQCLLRIRSFLSTPNGIRTRAATLKGWCPRPLDDGGLFLLEAG